MQMASLQEPASAEPATDVPPKVKASPEGAAPVAVSPKRLHADAAKEFDSMAQHAWQFAGATTPPNVSLPPTRGTTSSAVPTSLPQTPISLRKPQLLPAQAPLFLAQP